MRQNKSWLATSGILLILAVVLLVPSVAGAAGYKTLHKFHGKDGAASFAGLIFDPQGNLYGTTFVGGANNSGVVFEVIPNPDGSWKENVLYSFKNAPDGAYPYAGLTLDSAGNLYGTTGEGGAHDMGTVFKLAHNLDGTWTESVIKRFSGGKDGAAPASGVVFDEAGNLYGTTIGGGDPYCNYPNGCGVVFRLSPNEDGSWTESVIHAFCRDEGACNDGANPFAGLVFDPAGNLYGTTHGGGSYGPTAGGVVFKLTPNADGTWKENVLHRFYRRQGDGEYPVAGVILDASGNVYGTTSSGGDSWGTVFRLTRGPDGRWTERAHRFTHSDGGFPVAALTSDTTGNFYGTTSVGGINDGGTIFELVFKHDGELTVRTLHSFHPPEDGSLGCVILDPAGNLYGTVEGARGFGSVFEFTP